MKFLRAHWKKILIVLAALCAGNLVIQTYLQSAEREQNAGYFVDVVESDSALVKTAIRRTLSDGERDEIRDLGELYDFADTNYRLHWAKITDGSKEGFPTARGEIAAILGGITPYRGLFEETEGTLSEDEIAFLELVGELEQQLTDGLTEEMSADALVEFLDEYEDSAYEALYGTGRVS